MYTALHYKILVQIRKPWEKQWENKAVERLWLGFTFALSDIKSGLLMRSVLFCRWSFSFLFIFIFFQKEELIFQPVRVPFLLCVRWATFLAQIHSVWSLPAIITISRLSWADSQRFYFTFCSLRGLIITTQPCFSDLKDTEDLFDPKFPEPFFIISYPEIGLNLTFHGFSLRQNITFYSLITSFYFLKLKYIRAGMSAI